MKKVMLTISAITFLVFNACAGVNVPASVKAKFKKMYPQVQKASWDKEGSNYEAEFHLKKVEMSVLFDASANVLETESEIAVSALPQKARDYVAKKFPNRKIREASRIVSSKKVITYEAETKQGDLIFDASGNFIKQEKGD